MVWTDPSRTAGRERRSRRSQLELPGLVGGEGPRPERERRHASPAGRPQRGPSSRAPAGPDQVQARMIHGQRLLSVPSRRAPKPVPPRASAVDSGLRVRDRVVSVEERLEMLVSERRWLRPSERAWVLRMAKTAQDHCSRGLTERQAAVIDDIFDRFRRRLGA